MTEDEAEAVLLALGMRFEWVESDGGEDDTWGGWPVDDVDGEEAWYSIVPDTEGSNHFFVSFRIHHGDEDESAPMPFDSIKAAQAACERHYVTRIWDSKHLKQMQGLTIQEEEAHNSCKTQFCKEQVAEAALLSMGAVLEWDVLVPDFDAPKGFVWEESKVPTNDGSQTYDIESNPNHVSQAGVHVQYHNKDGSLNRERTRSGPELSVPKFWYNSLAEAKAACEIHAATGKFPPSVEAVESA